VTVCVDDAMVVENVVCGDEFSFELLKVNEFQTAESGRLLLDNSEYSTLFATTRLGLNTNQSF
jgi:hypothetical protein